MTDDSKRKEAVELLEQIAALSGWDSALDALKTIYSVDCHMVREGTLQ